MLAPLGGMLTPLAVSGAANVLASVPWVAQWKFNNNGNDSIGSNHLTAVNSPTFTTGKLGGATGATQLVAASTQYWSIADNAALSTGDVDFFVCAWVYLDNVTSNHSIISKNAGVGSREYYLYYNYTDQAPNNNFAFVVSGDGTNISTVFGTNFGAATANTWYFVAAWHDSTTNTIKLSVNNGTANSVSHAAGLYDSTAAVKVGAVVVSTYLMNGRVDNLCIAKGSGAVPTQAVLDALWNGGNGTETLT